MSPKNGPQIWKWQTIILQVSIIKTTVPRENNSIHRLVVSGSTDPGGQLPPMPTPASYSSGCTPPNSQESTCAVLKMRQDKCLVISSKFWMVLCNLIFSVPLSFHKPFPIEKKQVPWRLVFCPEFNSQNLPVFRNRYRSISDQEGEITFWRTDDKRLRLVWVYCKIV